MTVGRTASIHARLLNLAKARDEDFNLILTRYAIERFLYRLSLVPARDVYWLKGALLFDLWFDVPHRPTRDADFLGFGSADIGMLASTICEICNVVVDDGMEFDPASITTEEIREEANKVCWMPGYWVMPLRQRFSVAERQCPWRCRLV